MITLIECPRDAMQGIKAFIPTEEKVKYINQLLKVGFHSIDFGSFVSPKAIPQMADTPQVVKKLDLENTKSKLLAIVANIRGAEEAAAFEEISVLGYPFSISETFQLKNTNRNISSAFDDLKKISEICTRHNKQLVVYISMGFGNPYGDEWNVELVEEWLIKLIKEGITLFSLADTVGNAQLKDIEFLYSYLIPKYPELEIGAHFHSTPDKQIEKIKAAWDNGCRRFDSAMLGFGGCPMAKDDLVGNIATSTLIEYLNNLGEQIYLNESYFMEAEEIARILFAKYH